MPLTMQAAVLRHPGHLRVEERAWPEARPGWVVIAVETAGVCGTDLAVFHGSHPARLPVVLGHEFAGRVAAVGAGVTGLALGQPVIAEGSWPAPQPGNPEAREALGRTVDGCFAEAVAVPASAVHILPPGLDPLVAQSATTLATALHAANRAGELHGQRIAILGPGHAGLLLLQVCRLLGPAAITVFGTRPERLALAQQLGADVVIPVDRTDSAGTLSAAPGEFDFVFEAAGTPVSLAHAMQRCRPGGTVVCYGIIDQSLGPVDGYLLYAKELTLRGSRGAAGRYAEALQVLAAGKVAVLPLITHVQALETAPAALALASARREPVLRVVLTRDRTSTHTS